MEKRPSPFEPASLAEPAYRTDAPTRTLAEEFAGREKLLPREKLEQLGPTALSDAELLAILLRTGTQGRNVMAVAEDLLRTYGGNLGLLAKAGLPELQKQKGVGRVRGLELSALFEIARRILASSATERPALNSPERIAVFLRPFIVQDPREGFYVLPLDRKMKLCGPVSRCKVFSGTNEATPVHPRDIFHEAIRSAACFVVVAHNHPSGDPAPSPKDLKITRDIIEAGELLRIPLVDHIVIGDLPPRKPTDPPLTMEEQARAVPLFVSIRKSGAVEF